MQCEIHRNQLAYTYLCVCVCALVCGVSKRNVIKIFDVSQASFSGSVSPTFALYFDKNQQKVERVGEERRQEFVKKASSFKWKTC